VPSRRRSDDFKELELVVLRRELLVLRRQARPPLTSSDRVLLAARGFRWGCAARAREVAGAGAAGGIVAASNRAAVA
jgi:hypothetical protein